MEVVRGGIVLTGPVVIVLAGCMLQYALLHLAGYDSVLVRLVQTP